MKSWRSKRQLQKLYMVANWYHCVDENNLFFNTPLPPPPLIFNGISQNNS